MVLMSLGPEGLLLQRCVLSLLQFSGTVEVKCWDLWAPLFKPGELLAGAKNCTGTTFENLSSSSSPSVRPLILLLGTA